MTAHTPFMPSPFAIMMNPAKYDSLSDEHKKVLEEVGGVTGAKILGQGWDAADAVGLQTAKDQGGVLSKLEGAELEKWKEKIAFMNGVWVEKAKAAGLDGEDGILKFGFPFDFEHIFVNDDSHKNRAASIQFVEGNSGGFKPGTGDVERVAAHDGNTIAFLDSLKAINRAFDNPAVSINNAQLRDNLCDKCGRLPDILYSYREFPAPPVSAGMTRDSANTQIGPGLVYSDPSGFFDGSIGSLGGLASFNQSLASEVHGSENEKRSETRKYNSSSTDPGTYSGKKNHLLLVGLFMFGLFLFFGGIYYIVYTVDHSHEIGKGALLPYSGVSL